MVVYDYGVDIKSEMSFQDGDLLLSEYNDNISQAVINRLKTIFDSLDLFYEDYGSLFSMFLGWRRTSKTLATMKVELDSTLKQDPRINNFTSELKFNTNGDIEVNIVLKDNENTNLNLIVTDENVELIEE